MATTRNEMNTRLTFKKYKEGVSQYKNLGQDIFNEDKSYKCPTYVHRTPPVRVVVHPGKISGDISISYGVLKLLPKVCQCRNMPSVVPPMPTPFLP